MVRIYDYYNYQNYLRKYYEIAREADPGFSYRYIQGQIGIDPGYLAKVFQGKRELSSKYIDKFTALLKLNKSEAEYFTFMVKYSREKKEEMKQFYFNKLLKYHKIHMEKTDKNHYAFYNKWYYTVVRDLLSVYNVGDDYQKIAKLTIPQIRPSEAEQAIELLLELGFIEKNKDGFYKSKERFLTTGNEWISLGVRNFQKETLSLAQNALDTVEKDDRDISTLTMTMSKPTFYRVKNIIAECRKNILDTVYEDADVDQAYQVNFSLFPVCKKKENES